MPGWALPNISCAKDSMIVYVLHQDDTPLMPTTPAKARHLLRDGRAVVSQREPFTIQLAVPSGKRIQPVVCGVDLGAKEVGLAAVGNNRVLYQGEVALRTDIHKRMETRAMYRRTRRGKLRYRAPRFLNRASSRRKGRLPPSIQSRVDTTIKVVKRISGFLPVSTIRVETANFDTHAMKRGRKLLNYEYQRGELYGAENLKMYIRARDKYTCQYCGKKMPERLEVDHIIPRSRGGTTTTDNLAVSCHNCNQRKGKQTAIEFGYPELQEKVSKKRLRQAAITQMGKTATLQGLADITRVEETYGYITKVDRLALGFPKTHFNDAVAIACIGHPTETLPYYDRMIAVSRGARQQRRGKHSQTVARLPYEVFGYRMWDKVRLPNGTIGFVSTRRKGGGFRVRDIFGNTTNVTYKKLELISRCNAMPRVQVNQLALDAI